MLVECPNCHRKYEPIPGEKYCPCCGEEIIEPLKPIIEHEVKQENKSEALAKRRSFNSGKLMLMISSILIFVSFIFLFSNAVSGASIYQLMVTKDGNSKHYVGLILAFCVYLILLLLSIRMVVKKCNNENCNILARTIGVFEICLVIFYIFYLTYRFSKQLSYYYTSTNPVVLGGGAIAFLTLLLVSSILNLIGPKFDK